MHTPVFCEKMLVSLSISHFKDPDKVQFTQVSALGDLFVVHDYVTYMLADLRKKTWREIDFHTAKRLIRCA